MRQLWAIFLSLSLATAARLPRPEKPEKPEQLTMEDLANLWVENGGKGSACATAVAVAWTESKGDPGKKGYNSPGTVDRGLWQINDRTYPQVSNACAFHANCNTKAAIKISKNGKDWSQWRSTQPPFAYYKGNIYFARLACSRSARRERDDDQVPGYDTADEEDSNRPFFTIFGGKREKVDSVNSRFHVVKSFRDWFRADNNERKGFSAPVTIRVPTRLALSQLGRRLKKAKHLSMEAIAKLWKDVGGYDCSNAVAVAWAVSKGNANYKHKGRHGIWGMTLRDHPGLTSNCAHNAACVAHRVKDFTRHGSNWSGFPEYNDGHHLAHHAAAKKACQ